MHNNVKKLIEKNVHIRIGKYIILQICEYSDNRSRLHTQEASRSLAAVRTNSVSEREFANISVKVDLRRLCHS